MSATSPPAPMPEAIRDLPPLWLMRHGETEWNRAGRLQGHQDSPLTETGIDQARAAGQRLAALGPGAVALRLASPLGRAMATARLVFGPLPFETDPQLVEIGTGDWTGAHLPTLSAQFPDIFAAPAYEWYDRAPGGETLAGIAARIAGFLAGLPARAGGRPVVIVTHGVTLRMLRAQALGLDVADETHTHFPQGAIHHVEGGRARLL